MGLSFSTRRLVWSELRERLPNTIIFSVAFVGQAALGISLGVASAANRGRFTEKFVVGAGLFAYAVPTFSFSCCCSWPSATTGP